MTSRYFVDANGRDLPVLWHDTGSGVTHEVAWQYGHLDPLGVEVVKEYGPLLWRVVTGVLAPDEATVERLADELVAWDINTDLDGALTRRSARDLARAVLAAMAGPADTEETP